MREPEKEYIWHLDIHFDEPGTEGDVWSFCEDGKKGYDALHIIEQGDLITVFKDAAREAVAWQGTVDLEYQRNWVTYPNNSPYGQQNVFGCWVHGFQQTMEPEAWAMMFYRALPATLKKNEKSRKDKSPQPS